LSRACLAVGQHRRVLQSSPDSVPAWHGSSIQRPRGDAVFVMYLFECDSSADDHLLDGVGGCHRGARIGIDRLDKHPDDRVLRDPPARRGMDLPSPRRYAPLGLTETAAAERIADAVAGETSTAPAAPPPTSSKVGA
jgi:hypothetical protein